MGTKKQIVKTLLRSLGAGMCIAVGLYTFLQLDLLAGSIIFSFSFLSIFTLDLYLFSVLVPYSMIKAIPFLIYVFIYNILGTSVLMLLPQQENALTIVSQKLSDPMLYVFVEAMLCNILIYVAVEANKKKDTFTIILSVCAFMVCGFEHSISNIALFISARQFTIEALNHIAIVLLGNIVGGILIRKVHLGIDENCKDRKRLVE